MTAPAAVAPKADSGMKASAGVDDPILAGALDEMESEGVDLGAPATGPSGEEQTTETLPPETAPAPEVPAPEPASATPPAESAPATPPATPEPAADPLADTAPLDYAVDGQTKAFDGILIDKTNGGAFILPDKLESVRARFVEAERATVRAQQAADRVRQYEELPYRFTTKGADGKDQLHELKGYAAFEKLTADVAGNTAAGIFLIQTLLEAFPGDANKAALANVFKQAEFENKRVAFEAAQTFRQTYAQARAQERTTAQNATQETAWFTKALGQIQQALPALTPADMQAGREFFAKRPQLVYRNASAQDAVKFGVKVGERIADPDAMNEWFSERAALRAENAKTLAQTSTATSTAASHNAGMQKGRQPVQQTGARRPQAATPATIPEKRSRREAWNTPLTEALQELGINE